jgi:hypothetical protein
VSKHTRSRLVFQNEIESLFIERYKREKERIRYT